MDAAFDALDEPARHHKHNANGQKLRDLYGVDGADPCLQDPAFLTTFEIADGGFPSLPRRQDKAKPRRFEVARGFLHPSWPGAVAKVHADSANTGIASKQPGCGERAVPLRSLVGSGAGTGADGVKLGVPMESGAAFGAMISVRIATSPATTGSSPSASSISCIDWVTASSAIVTASALSTITPTVNCNCAWMSPAR
eukprot:scaffold7516_cov376-Prasinococcus_capsulatus_cf.AAC.4